jgi:hypothetical protein
LRIESILETLKPHPEMLPAGSMRKKREWGAGRMAFLTRRKAIQAELDAGRSLAAVHGEHHEALGIGYVQFTRYVRHYLRGSGEARPRPQPVRTPPDREAPPRQGFQFDPTAVDRKKLIPLQTIGIDHRS